MPEEAPILGSIDLPTAEYLSRERIPALFGVLTLTRQHGNPATMRQLRADGAADLTRGDGPYAGWRIGLALARARQPTAMCPDSHDHDHGHRASVVSPRPEGCQQGSPRPCCGPGSSRSAPCTGTAGGSPRRTVNTVQLSAQLFDASPWPVGSSSHWFLSFMARSRCHVPSMCP